MVVRRPKRPRRAKTVKQATASSGPRTKKRAVKKKPIPKQRRVDIGVKSEWLLNPAHRALFGKDGSKLYTSYGLLLRVLANTIYRDEIRANEARDGKNSRNAITMKVVQLPEWDRKFKAVIYDLVKQGQRMLRLENLPGQDESPTDTIVSLSPSGKDRLRQYSADEPSRMRVLYTLMESQLDDLWSRFKEREEQGA